MKTATKQTFVFLLIVSIFASSASSIFAQAKGSTAGPSSSQPPYVLRSVPGVVTKSILTVGDSVNLKPDGVTPYRMVGIPDGLGAFDNGDGTFTVLMNHEIASGGIVRAHGANGAFVSKWIIRKDDLTVLHGEDLIQNVVTWNKATSSYNAPATGIGFSRFCSADLALKSAFYNSETGLGYDGRIFMDGEEIGSEGRALGHLLDGTSYELPRLGKFSWENSVANPGTGDRTVVAGTDDSTPGGQVYIYIGTKTDTGSAVDKAGLTDGNLYGVKVTGVGLESRDNGIPSGTQFSLFNLGNVQNMTGAQIQTASVAGGVSEFLRPEDGSWDTSNPNDFYFVTTDRYDSVKDGTGSTVGRSRLYRLHFFDINDLTAGGTIDMLLDGTEDQEMMDNIAVSNRGQVMILEDVGNNGHLGRVWRYSIGEDTLNLVAEHDPSRFLAGGANFLTQDEETSGIIDVSSILGEGWFLLDVQAHYAISGELVEGGQLLALHYSPGKK
jgi:hypothetical protein